MRKINQINRIKYISDWDYVDENVVYRLFTYMGINWNLILRYHGIGAWTIRLCNSNDDEVYIFNSMNQMVCSINDDDINDIDGWYYEDLDELKNKLSSDLIFLLKKYEKYIN